MDIDGMFELWFACKGMDALLRRVDKIEFRTLNREENGVEVMKATIYNGEEVTTYEDYVVSGEEFVSILRRIVS